MENFVRDYGTGPSISDPPRFHSYANGSDPPPRPGFRPSQYTRSTSRPLPPRGNSLATAPPQPSSEEESPGANVAGVGAVGKNTATSPPALNSVPPARPNAPAQNGSYTPNNVPPRAVQGSPPYAAAQNAQTRPQESSPPLALWQTNQARPPASLHGNTTQALPGPTNGGPVHVRGSITGNPNNNTSARAAETSPSHTGPPNDTVASLSIGDAEDPIAKALEALKQGNAKKRTAGSIRRARGEDVGNPEQINGMGRSGTIGRNEGATGLRRARTPNIYDSQQPQQPQQAPAGITRSLSRKARPVRDDQDERTSGAQSSQLDLQTTADSIVGAHPSSRPSSPAPPSPRPQAAFMQPPQRAASPSLVEEYQQALPGERAERRMSMSATALASQQTRERPTSPRPTTPSQEPFAGIGAHGRSPSPQPMQLPSSRSTSPAPNNLPTGAQQSTRPLMQAPPSDPRQIQRTASPTGIAIDARGQVAHDALAEDYARRNQQAQYQRGASPQVPSQPVSQPTGPGVQAYPTGPTQGPYPPPAQGYPQLGRGPAPAADPTNVTRPMYGAPTVISPAPPPPQAQVQAHQRQGSGPPAQQPAVTGHYGGQVGYAHQRPPHLQQPTGPPPQTAPPPPPQQQTGAQQQFYSGHPYAQQPPPTVQPTFAPPVQQPQTNAYLQQQQQQQSQRQQSVQPSQTGYGQAGAPAQNAFGYQQRLPQQQQAPPPQAAPQHAYQQPGYNPQQPYPPQQQQQQQQPQQMQRKPTLNQPVSNQQQPHMARAPSPRAPPVSSHPGTESLEDGTPILFYGMPQLLYIVFAHL